MPPSGHGLFLRLASFRGDTQARAGVGFGVRSRMVPTDPDSSSPAAVLARFVLARRLATVQRQ